jgi:quinol monooxygenase YgiN
MQGGPHWSHGNRIAFGIQEFLTSESEWLPGFVSASILPDSLWAVAIGAEISQSSQTYEKKGVTRMLGVVATIKIKDGKGAEFEKVATELVKKVNENEKGCLLYQLYHGEVPNTYVFMERYADQAAVEAHRGTEYFKTLGRAMGEFMDGKPVVQRFKQVGA